MKREEWMEYLEPDEADLMEAEALLWGGADAMRECAGAGQECFNAKQKGTADAEKMRAQRNQGSDDAEQMQPQGHQGEAFEVKGAAVARQTDPASSHGRRRLSRKRWAVLFAACMLAAAFGIAAAASDQKQDGWLSSYFQAEGEKAGELLAQMAVETQAAAEDAGYRIEATECVSDGNSIYAVLKVTDTEGSGFDDRQYQLEGMPWKAADERLGGADFLAGGGYIEQIGRPAQDQAVFLLAWDVQEPIGGKQILLKLTGLIAYAEDGTEEVVAQGQWELPLEVPKAKEKTLRCFKKVEAGADTYYVKRVELTPLGVRIEAVKAVPFEKLWKTAEYGVKKYVLHKNAPLPEGWDKAEFEALSVSIAYPDGSWEEAEGQNNSGSGFSCEKGAFFKKLIDPDAVEAVRLGDTVIKIR